MATQRKTIPIKEHNRLMRKAEKTLFKQLSDITGLVNKIKNLEVREKNLEEQLIQQQQSFDAEIAFLNQRNEIQNISINKLQENLVNMQAVTLSLGRIIEQNEADIRNLKMAKYNNYYEVLSPQQNQTDQEKK